jgi:hypothetical protein
MATITEERRTYEAPPLRAPTPRGLAEEKRPEARRPLEEDSIRHTVRDVVRSATAEGFLAGGAAAVSILGLIGLAPETMLAVSVLGLSAVLFLQKAAITHRLTDWLVEPETPAIRWFEFSRGVPVEVLAGYAGVLLGVLSLLSVLPVTLAAVATLIFGAALLFGAGATSRLSEWHLSKPEESLEYWQFMRERITAAHGIQRLVGLGVSVLGVLALVGQAPLALALVSMLAIGTVFMVSATSICSRSLSYLHRT